MIIAIIGQIIGKKINSGVLMGKKWQKTKVNQNKYYFMYYGLCWFFWFIRSVIPIVVGSSFIDYSNALELF